MAKPTTKPQDANANERYAALQRKLEDLEKIHAEGKKSVSGLIFIFYINDLHDPYSTRLNSKD